MMLEITIQKKNFPYAAVRKNYDEYDVTWINKDGGDNVRMRKDLACFLGRDIGWKIKTT